MANRDLIWKSLLSAELNAGYYKESSDRYVLQDNLARYFGIVFGVSTFASLPFWALAPFVWQGLLVVNSLFSLATYVFKVSEKARTAGELSTKWKILSQHYDLLWAQIDEEGCPTDYMNKYENLLREEDELIKVGYALPNDDALRAKYTDAVWSLRGIRN